jgi:hypothetical protein
MVSPVVALPAYAMAHNLYIHLGREFVVTDILCLSEVQRHHMHGYVFTATYLFIGTFRMIIGTVPPGHCA